LEIQPVLCLLLFPVDFVLGFALGLVCCPVTFSGRLLSSARLIILGSYRLREIELLRLGHVDQDVISILEVGLVVPAGGALPTNNVRCNGVRSIILPAPARRRHRDRPATSPTMRE
jgi:hypothetical protein